MSKEERAIASATAVFTRYGFARTTMADIATGAGMSRPGLYLLFDDKEAIFTKVVQAMDERMHREIAVELKGVDALADKLLLACHTWGLHGIQIAEDHPDAADLFDFRFQVVRQVCANFAALVADLIAPAVEQSGLGITAADLARVLVFGMRGLRDAAADANELRRLITIQVATLIGAIHAGPT